MQMSAIVVVTIMSIKNEDPTGKVKVNTMKKYFF